jgi:prephenate dehydrogenase
MSRKPSIQSIGLLGFGAFGRLIARHLHRHFRLVVSDPALEPGPPIFANVRAGTLAEAARCDLVILAMPMDALAPALGDLRPHLAAGTVVVDTVSVKVEPARIMLEGLPADVEIIGTHPLFGPQSAKAGLRGHNIAICPVRAKGRTVRRIAGFLETELGLTVVQATPEEHDREAAVVQGLTHLIAKALVRMEPLPSQMTTASYELLMQATEMVRHDADGVFTAIEQANPFAGEVRARFFAIAEDLRGELESSTVQIDRAS